MRIGKRLLAFAGAFLLLAMFPVSAQTVPVEEEPMYTSYTYAVSKGKIQVLEAPAPYRTSALINSATLGVALGEPVDLCVYEQEIYIVDRANNCIYRTNEDFAVSGTIDSFDWQGKKQTFSSPEGIDVTADHIYIADTGNRRVVVLNKDGSCYAVITRPSTEVMSADLQFEPRKVAADGTGRVYAVCKGVYEGIMELYDDGSFGGFVGSVPVEADPLTVLWKSILSKEQRAKLENFIPVEYTNLSLDKDGFLYAVSLAAEGQDSIRRLNAADSDILVRSALGNIPVTGVVEEAEGFSTKGELSDFVDVITGENGVYYVLDSEYNRIFAYDENGNLLFVFGGRSSGQNGTFAKAAAIELLDDCVLVADSGSASITVFTRTDYADAMFLGVEQYRNDEYAASIQTWNTVLQYNRHFVLAYSKIGQAYYQMGDYEAAMDCFVTAVDQSNYSKAFLRYRTAWLSEHFTLVMLVIGGLIALIMVLTVVGRRLEARYPIKQGSVRDCLKYPLYVIFHPFDGFWDLKNEKRGRKWVATVLVILTIVAFAAERSLSGFAVSAVPDRQFDILYELKFVLIPLILFLVGNMSITTLMDGKGKFGQIYTAVGYALTPLILIKLPLTLVSNWFTQSEQMYLYLFNAIAIVWTAFLLFAALMQTHEYTAGKTIGTLLITFVAMVIICFICVLFFSLFTKLVGFVYTVIQETQYR